MLPPPPVLAPPDGATDGLKVTDGVTDGLGVAVATAETVGVGVTLAGGLVGVTLAGALADGRAGVVGAWVVHVGVGVGGGVWW